MIRLHFPSVALTAALLYGAEYLAKILHSNRTPYDYLLAAVLCFGVWILFVIYETKLTHK
jgi:hypothetical protein